MRAVDLSDRPKGVREELAGKFAHEDGFLTIPADVDDALELLVEVCVPCSNKSLFELPQARVIKRQKK